MTTTVEPGAVGVPTREHVLAVLLAACQEHRLPAPGSVHLWGHYRGVSLKLPDNQRGRVDAWITALRITTPATAYTDHVVYPGRDDEFIPYGVRWATSPLLPGYDIDIECHLDTRADPHTHGDGFTLPPTATPTEAAR